MSETLEALKTAFAGESQANRKYLAYAKKADEEGYPQIARLFRAAAHGETIHAHNELAAMDGIKTTAENLQDAIQGETYEFQSMYPPMVAAAETEGERKALRAFKQALEVEKVHARLYCEALEALQSAADAGESYEYYVCPVCGYVHARSAPERCPVCGTLGARFEKID